MSQLTDTAITRLTEIFRVLGDPTRVRILDALVERERNVGDLATGLGLTQSAVSHQLRLLRGARIVRPAGRAGRCSTRWTTSTCWPSIGRGSATHSRTGGGSRGDGADADGRVRRVRGPRRGRVPRGGPALQRRGGHPGAPAQAPSRRGNAGRRRRVPAPAGGLRRRPAGPGRDGGCRGRCRPAHVARARGAARRRGGRCPAHVVHAGVGRRAGRRPGRRLGGRDPPGRGGLSGGRRRRRGGAREAGSWRLSGRAAWTSTS